MAHTNQVNSNDHEDEERKKKKVRTTFTGRQIFELEKMFESKKYLSSSERADMAKLLNVTEQQVMAMAKYLVPSSYSVLFFSLQVKIWFQNRRTKWKKQENISNAEAAELMKSKGQAKPDPVKSIKTLDMLDNSNSLPPMTSKGSDTQSVSFFLLHS